MEETFGPIVPVVRVPDDDEAVMRISNSTAFGLSSGVCTNDFRRMQAYIRGLRVGTVNIWEVPGYRIEMRSEEHTSELQTLMRISYAVFCLKKKINNLYYNSTQSNTHELYLQSHNKCTNLNTKPAI